MKNVARPKITAFFTDDEMARIEDGPLRITSGRGKAAWLHNVAMKATEDAEDELLGAKPRREE
jgi:hypothetical protein